MREGCGLPTERLARIELFVSCSRRNDPELLNDWKEPRDKALTRVLYPPIIRVGDDNYLTRIERKKPKS
jgi:hypothetical protein